MFNERFMAKDNFKLWYVWNVMKDVIQTISQMYFKKEDLIVINELNIQMFMSFCECNNNKGKLF